MNTSFSLNEQLELSKTISKTRKEIEDYFYEQVDYKSDLKNNELNHTGKQWIKKGICIIAGTFA